MIGLDFKCKKWQISSCADAAFCAHFHKLDVAIGLDLARAGARLIMLDWDRLFIQLARENRLNLCHYSS